jgi:hypothetical protein
MCEHGYRPDRCDKVHSKPKLTYKKRPTNKQPKDMTIKDYIKLCTLL